jgi:hypothetical protein
MELGIKEFEKNSIFPRIGMRLASTVAKTTEKGDL